MSDGLEEFRQRLRDAIKRKRDMASFNPQVVLQRLLSGTTRIAMEPPYPTKAMSPDIGGFGPWMEPPTLENEPIPKREKLVELPEFQSVEEKRKEIRKKYPFTGWQK